MTTPLSDADLERLREGCEGVTPGPWERHGNSLMVNGAVDTWSGPVLGTIYQAEETIQADAEGRTWQCWGDQSRNAAHIANCDPQTIASLVTELLAAREALDMKPGWSLERGYRDHDEEGDYGWCVYEVSGGINDREWDLIGFGETPFDALTAARRAIPQGDEAL